VQIAYGEAFFALNQIVGHKNNCPIIDIEVIVIYGIKTSMALCEVAGKL
jgi:hypothetical protein